MENSSRELKRNKGPFSGESLQRTAIELIKEWLLFIIILTLII